MVDLNARGLEVLRNRGVAEGIMDRINTLDGVPEPTPYPCKVSQTAIDLLQRHGISAELIQAVIEDTNTGSISGIEPLWIQEARDEEAKIEAAREGNRVRVARHRANHADDPDYKEKRNDAAAVYREEHRKEYNEYHAGYMRGRRARGTTEEG